MSVLYQFTRVTITTKNYDERYIPTVDCTLKALGSNDPRPFAVAHCSVTVLKGAGLSALSAPCQALCSPCIKTEIPCPNYKRYKQDLPYGK